MGGAGGDLNGKVLDVGRRSTIADRNREITIRYDNFILDIIENVWEHETDDCVECTVVMQPKLLSGSTRLLLNSIYDMFLIATVLDILGYSVYVEWTNGEVVWEKTVYNNDNN